MKFWIAIFILALIGGAIALLLHKPEVPYEGEYHFEKPQFWTWVQQERMHHPVARAPRSNEFYPTITLYSQEHGGSYYDFISNAVKYCEIAFGADQFVSTETTHTNLESGATGLVFRAVQPIRDSRKITLDNGTTGLVHTALNFRFPDPVLQDQVFIQTNNVFTVLTYTRLYQDTNDVTDTEAWNAIQSFIPPMEAPE